MYNDIDYISGVIYKMDFGSWFDNMSGLASIYSFDILPDGSFGELKIQAVNKNNARVLNSMPNTPDFYPGVAWREYYDEINHEKFCFKCGSENVPLYSYVYAHESWIKGFYLPIAPPEQEQSDDGKRTAYLMYVMSRTDKVDAEAMSHRSAETSAAVIKLTINMHKTQDFLKAMVETVGEIRKVCGSERCSLLTVDKDTEQCRYINEYGEQRELLDNIARSMDRTPLEVALQWEKDLAGSDCMLLEDLSLLKERDPVWYNSLSMFGIRSIVLFAVRFNKAVIGFIWAANFDKSKLMHIKETLELTSFLIGAVIANHQLMSKLEIKSSIDELTQVNNRNSMNERIDGLISGKEKLPATMGVAFTDLNGLKTMNDSSGHAAGDKMLSRAASLLKLAFGDHEIYRAGGDEFVILCPDINEKSFARKTAQFRTLVDATEDVSFAIGTVWVSGEYDINRAMQAADARMYEDKEKFYRLNPDKERCSI